MRRILLVLAVAAMMAVMMVAMATPAFASKFFGGKLSNCGQPGGSVGEFLPQFGQETDFITSGRSPQGTQFHECPND